MEKLKMHSPDLVAGNIEKIAALFPNCITETKDATGKLIRAVDFDLLKQELSGSVVEGPQERYRLDWPGKREALLAANAPIAKSLRPEKGKSKNFETTKNILIEGDNLDALKLLQESYLGKVSLIEIDPPYNTGKDFIYKDSFSSTKEEYLLASNQSTEEGIPLVSNSESNGRFHSDWLNMIFPRLRLCRNLLADDGLIFIHIDDAELENLRKVCHEIFGEENFVANIVWANKEGGGGSDSKEFRIKHEYILCYAKCIESISIGGIEITNRERYTEQDEFVDTRGPYYLQKLGMGSLGYVPTLDFPITAPDGTEVHPNIGTEKVNRWRWGRDKVAWGLDNKFIHFQKDRAGRWQVYTKQYLKCDNEGKVIERENRPMGIIEEFSSTQASKQLQELFSGKKIFSYPKPTDLIEYLLKLVTKPTKEHLILDFFAGSGTVGHAVMSLNAKDGGNRRFLLVQVSEPVPETSDAKKAGFNTVAEITAKRIEIASGKLEKENRTTKIDFGFRYFRIDRSNFSNVFYKPDDFSQESLLKTVENFRFDRKPEDLLFQVMLDWGLDLGLPITSEKIAGKNVYFVDCNALAACFDSDISEELVTTLAKRRVDDLPLLKVVFRDAGYADDSAKINVEQIFKLLSPTTELRTL
jgi:adenine-specific DNA-methyltransferase